VTPPKVKAALRKRASSDGEQGEWCEIQLTGCQGLGVDPAHRIGQKRGGRKGEAYEKNNRLSNLLWACRACHDWCHAMPVEAEDFGYVLREHHDPLAEPVAYRGQLSYLTDDGRVLDYFEVNA
jgi:hypothetical protein